MKNVDDIYRLSPMQQGMLFHSVSTPGVGTYVEQVYWTWTGSLDLPTFQRATQRLLERHTPLRTSFLWERMKEPLQAVRRAVEPAWRLEDWTQEPAQVQQERFTALLEDEKRRGFVLKKAPLLRFSLVKFDATHTRCVLTYHHLILDGWSLPVCLRELFLTYDAFSRGEEPKLEPTRPYRDYIRWLAEQDPTEAERFWRERLKGFTAATPLTVGRASRPSTEVRAYGTQSLRLGAGLSGRLAAFSRQNQLTASTLVQGAWALLLGRYSGQADVAFGMVVSGRPATLPGVDSMLGTFINTQVSRVRLPPDATVSQWLKEVQADQFAARNFEHVSLADVQNWSEIPRGQSLFETLFVFQNLPRRGVSAEMTDRLPVEEFTHTLARTGYPLVLMALPDASDLELQLTYDEVRFDADTMRRMLGHVARLMESLLDSPGARLVDLAWLAPEERQQVLHTFNGTRAEPAYVLDASLQPMPVGVPGELYVGGDGLAQDSLQAPALAAERFIPHPFSSTPGARLYRTGDRARWLADGTLERLEHLERKNLPQPQASETSVLAPRTPREESLAALWAEILDVPPPGVHENFFQLGGSSLSSVLMLARVQESLGVEVPLERFFEKPTIAALAALLPSEPGEPPAPELPQSPPLLRQPREGALPLSFAQQRLWFLDQLSPGTTTYNIPAALQIDGALDTSALHQSLYMLVRRHESLRTTFEQRGDSAVQVIHSDAHVALPVTDLSTLPEAQRTAEARRLATQEAQTPFNLEKGPLLRASLLRLSPLRHVLLVTMHHIVSDGWSLGVLVREVAAAYQAFSSGQSPSLPLLAVQYADYAAWQRDWLQGPVLEAQLDWWKQQLGDLPVLALPTDRPRPVVQSFRGRQLCTLLPTPLVQELESLGRREGATLFMLLLTAFQALLSRYTGQHDIVIGTDTANRGRPELEPLIGFFVNQLVLRGDLSGDPSFRDQLARTRLMAQGAYAHQDVPFEELVRALNPERNRSHAPLFQIKLGFQEMASFETALQGLAIQEMEFSPDTGTAKLDLALNLTRSAQGLRVACEYATDLFDETTIARLIHHFGVLLEGIVARPEARLSELPLLTAEERQQVLLSWNDTAGELPGDTCLPLAFERQAALTPDAPAVRFEDSALSFDQLNVRANQLAHYLRSLGIGPDVRVALRFERSVDMVVALLGVMKAGGAYVPLDPAWPPQRLDFALQDCAAPVLITQRHLAASWQPAGTHVLCLDAQDLTLASQPGHNPTPLASPETLAYVIYTSGSTGTPKGVMVWHGAVLNLHRALRRTVYEGLPMGLRVSVNAPLAFDASVQQLVQLLDGHCLCIVPEAIRQDAEAMVTWLRRNRVDVLDCTPSLLRLLLQAGLLEGDSAPARLVPGGEALDEATWKVLSDSKRTRSFNVYGPTECTVDATAFAVREGTRPSLGGPLLNVRTYVLDAHLRPVPVGVPGELFISGAGLARGYLGRPALTAEKFIPNPFSTEPGARMYRTGDKARWREDGTLEYLGRLDFQVKLRGFRIELEEIETTLRQHAAVNQALVLVREDVPGDQRLVAYIVPFFPLTSTEEQGSGSDFPKLDTQALRDALKARLPEYMVPSAFVLLQALPLTPNGKVDRKALPAPDVSGLASMASFVAPRNPLERELAEIWEELLGVKPIGVKSHFFELGGHSLLAVRLMARIRERLQRDLPLATLFQAPTVEQLAALLLQVPAPFSPLVPIQPEGTGRPFFCVHAVGGNVMIYAELAKRLGPDQPFYGLQARGLDGRQPPLESIKEMAALYIDSIRAIQPHGPYQLGGWSMGGLVAYEMACQLQAQGETTEVLALIDPSPSTADWVNFDVDDPQQVVAHFTGDHERLAQHGVLTADAALSEQGLDAVVERLLATSRATGQATPEVGGAQARLLYDVFTSNLRAVKRYEPGPFTGPLLVLRASERSPSEPLDLGWSAQVPHAEVHEVRGNHFSLLQSPRVQDVADRLAEQFTSRSRRLD